MLYPPLYLQAVAEPGFEEHFLAHFQIKLIGSWAQFEKYVISTRIYFKSICGLFNTEFVHPWSVCPYYRSFTKIFKLWLTELVAFHCGIFLIKIQLLTTTAFWLVMRKSVIDLLNGNAFFKIEIAICKNNSGIYHCNV